ncbi:MAG TPA: DUF3761 domain-containing protein [Solirubrobacteraceae bacterium]|nr:DUF3761 domain-containing protein [Solirubrobacteraceae bacterium]
MTWALALTVATLSGCAGATDATTSTQGAASVAASEAAATPVALHLNTGSYSLSAPTATVRGTVTRGASVRVNGHAAYVHAGRWSRTLALRLGRNRVAVLATMGGRTPARKSIEITRERSAAELEAQAVKKQAEQRQASEAAERKASEEAAKQKAAIETPVCTNGTYVNSAGNTVCRPEESPTVPAGATAECQDGTYSFSESRSGTCSHHGGVARWLN